MPAVTKIKLRAGTQSAWSATAKTQTNLSSPTIVGSGDTAVIRYLSSGHTFAVNNLVSITGFTVSSGTNPYNVSGGVITAVVAGVSFDILVPNATGGTPNGTGTAKLVVLDVGEAAVETDTSKLKIGDGTTDWSNLLYVNTPSIYVTNQDTLASTSTSVQNLFLKKLPLKPNTTYVFDLGATILRGSATNSATTKFGFAQPASNGWSSARYTWTAGTRSDTEPHYSLATKSFVGSSSTIDIGDSSGGIDLYPADTNLVVIFNIKGIFRTGSASSFFQPQIRFSAAPGTDTAILTNSFMRVQQVIQASSVSTPDWV